MQDDPEDILSASLQTLYGLSPVSFSTAGSVFTYPITPGRVPGPPHEIHLATPETDPSNWSLHASSIWVAALFLADHLEELHLPYTPVRVLELGAGAGLPSIFLARMHPRASVTASDYPDARLLRTLADNITRNAVAERCRAVPHAWGADPPGRFDVVLAADTLWDPALHVPLVETLCGCLVRGPEARVHLVAGLHTGRYTIQSFLNRTRLCGLVLESATEREVGGTQARPWDVGRAEGEDERERRRWVVWMILKWEPDVLES